MYGNRTFPRARRVGSSRAARIRSADLTARLSLLPPCDSGSRTVAARHAQADSELLRPRSSVQWPPIQDRSRKASAAALSGSRSPAASLWPLWSEWCSQPSNTDHPDAAPCCWAAGALDTRAHISNGCDRGIPPTNTVSRLATPVTLEK